MGLRPVKVDAVGRKSFPPEVLIRWKREGRRAMVLQRCNIGGVQGHENRIPADELTGVEWLSAYEQARRALYRVINMSSPRDKISPAEIAQRMNPRLNTAIFTNMIGAVIEKMPQTDWETLVGRFRDALLREPEDDESLADWEKRVRTIGATLETVLHTIEVAQKGLGGKFEQPEPSPQIHNTLNINDPHAIAAFIGALKMKGYRIEGPAEAVPAP